MRNRSVILPLYKCYTQGSHDLILMSRRSKYVEPTIDEGYAEIVRVNFVAQFQSEEQEKLYKLFLLEN